MVEETEFLVSICCPAQSCHKADLAMKAGFSLSSDSDSSLEPPESGSDSDSREVRRDYKRSGYNPTTVGDVSKSEFHAKMPQAKRWFIRQRTPEERTPESAAQLRRKAQTAVPMDCKSLA